MSEAELRTLIIKQLESPLRPEDRADVIMRAIHAIRLDYIAQLANKEQKIQSLEAELSKEQS